MFQTTHQVWSGATDMKRWYYRINDGNFHCSFCVLPWWYVIIAYYCIDYWSSSYFEFDLIDEAVLTGCNIL